MAPVSFCSPFHSTSLSCCPCVCFFLFFSSGPPCSFVCLCPCWRKTILSSFWTGLFICHKKQSQKYFFSLLSAGLTLSLNPGSCFLWPSSNLYVGTMKTTVTKFSVSCAAVGIFITKWDQKLWETNKSYLCQHFVETPSLRHRDIIQVVTTGCYFFLDGILLLQFQLLILAHSSIHSGFMQYVLFPSTSSRKVSGFSLAWYSIFFKNNWWVVCYLMLHCLLY